jgi:hypothetical protein
VRDRIAHAFFVPVERILILALWPPMAHNG